jgi:hypothetical protein
MLFEIMFGFGGTRLIKLALEFRTTVRQPIFRGALFSAAPLGSLAGCPEIDDFSHA